MALLFWGGGAMAFVGGMPQLGWAIWGVVVINAVFWDPACGISLF